MNPIIDQLQAHRSIRKFTDQPVPDDLLKTLVAAAQCAPTSHHVQAYTLIEVKNKENRSKIAQLAGPQVWVDQAPVFLVFCADLSRLVHAARLKGADPQTGWTEQFIVATVDAALVAQNLLTAAESMGLGGVIIGGIRNDPDQVCELLDIPDQVYPVFGMCLGYPDQDPEVKPRLPLDLVLKTDTYPDKADQTDTALNAYDQTLEHYYQTRGSNLKEATWTGLMARFMETAFRPHMKSFLEKKGFIRN